MSHAPRIIAPISESDKDRFWSKVDKLSHPDGCWLWEGFKPGFGYGFFSVKGTLHRAHRVSFTIANGDFDLNLHVLHSCNNPACVNPDHLRTGTHTDNMQDKVRSGRCNAPKGDRNGSRLHPERLARGDRCGSRLYPERLKRGDAHYSRNYPEKLARGSRNGNSKLDDDKVRQIRELYATTIKSSVELGRMFGIDHKTILAITHRQTWKHVI